MDADEPLTAAEWRVLDLLAAATNTYAGLPEHHPSDLREWENDIHHLQHRVMARAAHRAQPAMFTPMRAADG